jgi:dihydrofolate synthase/folylpolyglutamate synthase
LKKQEKTKRDIILIVGMMKDKEMKAILRELGGASDKIIVTGLPYERAHKPDDLARKASKYFRVITRTETMKEAIDTGRASISRGGLLCITGSLYSVAEARKVLNSIRKMNS